MTKDEKFNLTAEKVDEWFYKHSRILESCYIKESTLIETHGEGNHMCPYYVALLELVRANIAKGWTKEELIKDINELF